MSRALPAPPAHPPSSPDVLRAAAALGRLLARRHVAALEQAKGPTGKS